MSTPPMPKLPLDKALGAILAGSWFNAICFTLQVTQVVRYCYQYFRTDRAIIRAVVLSTFIINLAITLLVFASVYLYTVTHWGDIPYLLHIDWPIATWVVLFGFNQVIVQTFLIIRYHILSGSRLVSGLLGCVSAAALASSLWAGIQTYRFPKVPDRDHLTTALTVWVAFACGSHMLIAMALVWTLSRKQVAFVHTKSLLRRIAAATLASNTLTSVFVGIGLILYLCDNASNAPLILSYSASPVMALTVLFNLNRRGELRSRIGNTAMSYGQESRPMEIRVDVDREANPDGKAMTPTKSKSIELGEA